MGLFVLIVIVSILGAVVGGAGYFLTMVEAEPEKYSAIAEKIPFKLSEIFGSLDAAKDIATKVIIGAAIAFVVSIFFIIIIKKHRKNKTNKGGSSKSSTSSSKDYKIKYNGNTCELNMKVSETDAFKEAWERAGNEVYNRGFNVVKEYEYKKDGNLRMVFGSTLSNGELKKLDKKPNDGHHITIKNSEERVTRTKKTLPYYGNKMYTDGTVKQEIDGDYNKYTKDYCNTYAYMTDNKNTTYTSKGYTYRVDVEYRHIVPDGECPIFKTGSPFPNQYQSVHYGAGFFCCGYRSAATYVLKDDTILTEIGLKYRTSQNASRVYYGDDAVTKRIFESSSRFCLCSYVSQKGGGGWTPIEDGQYLGFAIGKYFDEYYLVITEDISCFEEDVAILSDEGEDYLETPDEVTKLVARIDKPHLELMFALNFHEKLAEELSDREYLAPKSIDTIVKLFKDKELQTIVDDYMIEIFDVLEEE